MKSIPRGRPGEFGRNATGFTLIEISVVLFLIALMALLVMPSMMGFMCRGLSTSRVVRGRARDIPLWSGRGQ